MLPLFSHILRECEATHEAARHSIQDFLQETTKGAIYEGSQIVTQEIFHENSNDPTPIVLQSTFQTTFQQLLR